MGSTADLWHGEVRTNSSAPQGPHTPCLLEITDSLDGGLESGRRCERGGVWEPCICDFYIPEASFLLLGCCCGAGDLGLHFPISTDLSN